MRPIIKTRRTCAWSIRIDQATSLRGGLFLGVVRPHAAVAGWAHGKAFYAVSSHSWCAVSDGKSIDIGLPCLRRDAPGSGSVYHFTADMSAGTLRVRPVLAGPHAPHATIDAALEKGQTEWVIAEGIRDLAECRAYVSMFSAGAGCTLLPDS
jgi:hypothetical protein